MAYKVEPNLLGGYNVLKISEFTGKWFYLSWSPNRRHADETIRIEMYGF